MIFILALVTGTISGKVYDFHTHKPLEAVSIVLEGTPYGTLSSDSGEFLLKGVPEGEYTLSATRVGYRGSALKVRVAPDSTLRLRIELVPEPVLLKPIEVLERFLRRPGFRTLKGEEVRKIPGAEKDIFRVLQTLPGVGMTSDYWGRLYVRGGTPEENLYLLDGTEVFHPYHFLGFTSVFNPELIHKMRFSPGGFGPQYGNCLSSVLELTTKDGKAFQSEVSLDPVEMGGLFSSPISQWSNFILSGRYSYIDRYLERLNIVEGVVLPQYYDIQGKWEFTQGFYISGLRSKEEVKAQVSFLTELQELRWENTSNTLGMALSLKFPYGFSGLTQAYFTQGRGGFWIDIHPKSFARREDISKMGLRQSFKAELLPGLGIEFGGEAFYTDYFYQSNIPEEILHFREWDIEMMADTSSWLFGGYLLFSYRFPKFRIDMGERLDYLRITQEMRFSPRFSLLFPLNPNTSIRMGWGIYNQFPRFEYLSCDVKSEVAKHYLLEFSHRFSLAELKLSIYDKELTDLVLWDGGIFRNQGRGFSRGIEVILQKRLHNGWFGWFSYSYSISRRSSLVEEEPLPADGDQPHILNLLFGLPLPWKVYLSTRLRYSSGAPYTPVIGRYWDGWKWVIRAGRHNSARLPAYRRWDIRIERRIGKGSIYLSIINLLGVENLQAYIYSSDGTEYKPLYMMPRIPLLGLELRF